jgi:uncharacterized membrane protein YebE (DUF533 family)
MGFDQLASALSGLVSGAIAGFALGLLLIRKLSRPLFGRAVVGATIVAVSLVGWGMIKVRREMARAESEASAPSPTTPTTVPR